MMTIACENENKPSGQIKPVLDTDFTDSAEKSKGTVENGVLPKKTLPTKEATSSSKGYSGILGLWNDRSPGAGDGFSMAPQPSYGFQPSGIMKYYGPAGIYPSYPKQGQLQNGRPMEQKLKGRTWNESSRFTSRDKPTKKGDCEASDELTCGPRVINKRNDSGVSGPGDIYFQKKAPQPSYGFQPSGIMKYYGPAEIYPSYPKQGQLQNDRPMEQKLKGRTWNESSRFTSRDKPTKKGDCEASDELTCGPRVNKRNDSGVSGPGDIYFQKKAPQPSYGFQPSGIMKYYDPAGIYPSYPKQGQLQNGRPMEQNLKGRTWNESSRFTSKDKPIKKGDCEASDELTCGPRVNKRNDSGVSGPGDKCNVAEFQTKYERAKFYVIKSYSEDDVHKCIKYDVWSSTVNGNKRLDAAFHDAEVKVGELGNCPIFLFFSVNGSGQFVGLAEMIGKVDFNKSMNFWQLDKWSGFFPVKWHIMKDIPNAQLRHILLENNGNRPVTYTRDTQEIGLKEGLEMLKIFKDYAAKSSILDDFEFYEDRGKAEQQACSSSNRRL